MKTRARLLLATLALAAFVGCADENDPKTWVKRLDDPAQRAPAIKRLGQFFEDAMTKNNKNRDSAEVKGLLDMIVEPMAQQYTKGGLDDKTRKELIKELADMRDPRIAPALAKAFQDYEAGKSDEDVRYAAQAAKGLAETGKFTDQTAIDALWTCFGKFSPTKSKSINTTTDLHDAVLAVKHPSYGPKAVEKLAAKVVLDDQPVNDQTDFWQMTAVQVIKELNFKPAAKALVTVLVTREKIKLANVAKAALMKMPKEAVPQLISALNAKTDFAVAEGSYGAEKGWLIPVIDVLSYISTPDAKKAVLGAIPGADNDDNRRAFALYLVQFPTDSATLDAFKATYAKLPPIASKPDVTGKERLSLLALADKFYEPAMVPWMLKEASAAKGDLILTAQVNAIVAAIKIMQPDQTKLVEEAMKSLDSQKMSQKEKEDIDAAVHKPYTQANALVSQCNKDASCYVKVLDETIPAERGANAKAIKAAAMAATLGNDATRAELVTKVAKVLNPGARLATVEAIDHLAPNGDVKAAEALEKVVEDSKSNKELGAANDAVYKVALRLRARAGQ
jgi:hypothetical protein